MRNKSLKYLDYAFFSTIVPRAYKCCAVTSADGDIPGGRASHQTTATAGVLNRSSGSTSSSGSAGSPCGSPSAPPCVHKQAVRVASTAVAAGSSPKLSRGGLCCMHEGATDDEDCDTGGRPVFRPTSTGKVARFHELRRQASASAKASPEQRKREASPPLCHVELRGRKVVKKTSLDNKFFLVPVPSVFLLSLNSEQRFHAAIGFPFALESSPGMFDLRRRELRKAFCLCTVD
ncbi:hypothetical protein HPB48_020549 [Haemaphysalis longicornis]|uniref:Uncharacterized protein n=1 Tax=Haemaphysalis longicornis TaxID=44386 RepID=A0A9J6G5W7_HAELO|nr:hypothetical protein HPB48_020549 [Haemaphysalis longicornis]